MTKTYQPCNYHCLVVCLVLMAVACHQPSNNQTKTIDPSPKDEIIRLNFPETKSRDSTPGLLSTIASDIEYIPLETTPGCLLSEFVVITPSMYGYFVKDKDQVYRFLPNGKYRCKINIVGKGPNEYKCSSFFVDDSIKLIVSTGYYSNKFFFTDFDGKVQYALNYPKNTEPNHGIRAIKQMGNNKFIAIYYNEDGRSKLLFSILDYQGNTLHEEPNPFFIKETFVSNGPGTMSLFAYSNYGLFLVNGHLFYLNNPSDTIFSFPKGFSKEIHALINTGGYTITKEEEIKINAGLLSGDLYKERRSNFVAGESERFLFLAHYSFGKSRLAIWDKDSDRAIFNYYPDFKDDIDKFRTVYIYPSRIKDSYLYSDIQALDFIEYYKQNSHDQQLYQNTKIKSVMDEITEDSNPIIIKIQLKK
jgi:hypothetical protein